MPRCLRRLCCCLSSGGEFSLQDQNGAQAGDGVVLVSFNSDPRETTAVSQEQEDDEPNCSCSSSGSSSSSSSSNKGELDLQRQEMVWFTPRTGIYSELTETSTAQPPTKPSPDPRPHPPLRRIITTTTTTTTRNPSSSSSDDS